MENQSLLKEHLYQLEKRLLEPETRTTPAELEKLLADDFFEFGSSGNVWYKKDCVGEGGLSVSKMTLYDFDIHPLSEDVVLTTYRVKDETRMQHTLRSSIWKFIDGRWQMFFHQGTIIKS
ncbi:DUF4440 domain-containing protein [Geobacillus sp. NFOSA3]|jgi:hypothetical protein|uniref:DUF4440 domain-containing protein n=2 Tax=Parageobacillus TaxID=1906945 RepID=A0A150MYH7_9BACL|nr:MULTISPECIES: DUF4440 domain-containing protein [Parageobacillus]NNU94001.1 DUF4440 domain-containing protein [Geobacillus sp. NFOSA3]KYD29494.1 hypothetical protein B4110_1064 [Parageobacillus toebii]MED4968488.1 DUF4440 domain-containing protein [Parageobacillus toebii]MED4989314.1 DUF4440 domain-containing protein [Parageobacillus toebii]OXB94608.1 DUF4440 domain-containing protein [Parageobacillus galactosidasius]